MLAIEKMDDAACRMHINTHTHTTPSKRSMQRCCSHAKLRMIQITILMLQMIVFVLNKQFLKFIAHVQCAALLAVQCTWAVILIALSFYRDAYKLAPPLHVLQSTPLHMHRSYSMNV